MKIGIIGGSGLDDPEFLHNETDTKSETPFGLPSSPLRYGTVAGKEVILIARHGQKHTFPPTQVNYRANIWALKAAGVKAILATTAVGSLREEIGRGDFVILDQFIDFTRRRAFSFYEKFEPGEAKHTAMADPFDASLRAILIESCRKLDLAHHQTGTVVTIEGPRFSTRAESEMFRIWGADVINMSIAPECALANEAGVPYAAVGMATDYDCWKAEEEPVSWDMILEIFQANTEKVTGLLLDAIASL